jgi:hypothetical protein
MKFLANKTYSRVPERASMMVSTSPTKIVLVPTCSSLKLKRKDWLISASAIQPSKADVRDRNTSINLYYGAGSRE